MKGMKTPRSQWSGALHTLVWTALALPLVAGCASTGATFRSGVGDTFLEHPPYYAGRDLEELGPGLRPGHLPVSYQPGATQASIFDPSWSPAMVALLDDMTAYLDGLGTSVRLAEGGKVSAVSHRDSTVPPDVQFGCEAQDPWADEPCVEEGDEALGRGRQVMRLAVGRPSPEWVAWTGELMAATGTNHVLVLTLEVTEFPLRQEGIRGRKVVELGTDHTARFPWLTSLETPVQVLQLTGALMGPDGRAVRIGAEGLTAKRTSLLASTLGAQALISDEDIETLRTARRDDLPGEPLVWQEALRTLVEQLTGRRTDG